MNVEKNFQKDQKEVQKNQINPKESDKMKIM